MSGGYHATYDRPPSKKQLGILKAGSLYISGRGMGWKSWKKRWFILTKTPTRTALVYFRGEPNGPINPSDALDGINLVNTGRVLAKLDKKMISLMFPDNRSYTFKAESLEELDGWRQVLERALIDAPDPEPDADLEPAYKSDPVRSSGDFSGEPPPPKKRPQKSLVIGRPILLALEDIDGSPSFLEKALCFIETVGLNVEGILRHSADVELVEKRVQAYEQGENEFRPTEDAHVIGDCIKHVLRELPSSPVPDLCCSALIKAYRKPNRNVQVEEMRLAVADSFPEPNRRLLQRLLRMMLTVSSNSSVNRMNADAVARCMAPLLLRPIFAGDVQIFSEWGGGITRSEEEQAMQQAMNAANVGGALIRAMMQEFDNIFMEEEHLTGATLPRSLSHSDDIYRDTSRASYQTSIPSHLSRDSEASTSGVRMMTSLDESRARHDISGAGVSRSDSDAQQSHSDAQNSYSDGVRGYSDVQEGAPHALTEQEEVALIEALSQQRDALEVAVWRRKEENAGLKDGMRQRKMALQEQRQQLEEEVRRLNGALVYEADQHSLLEIAMGAASAMLEHSKDLDPEAQVQLQEIVALEKDVTRLRAQIDDAQNGATSKRNGAVLADTESRVQRILSLTALSQQLEMELAAVKKKYAEEKQKNEEMLAQIVSVDITARENDYAKQQTLLAEAQEQLRLETTRAQLLQQTATLKEQNSSRGATPPPISPGGSNLRLPRPSSPVLTRPKSSGGVDLRLKRTPPPVLTRPNSSGGADLRLNRPPSPGVLVVKPSASFGSVNMHRLGSDGAHYLKDQLEAAGIVPSDDDGRDSPSVNSRRSNQSSGELVSTPHGVAAVGLGALDSQVAYSQERRMQLMRQLQELSSPSRSRSGYSNYREPGPYVVSP